MKLIEELILKNKNSLIQEKEVLEKLIGDKIMKFCFNIWMMIKLFLINFNNIFYKTNLFNKIILMKQKLVKMKNTLMKYIKTKNSLNNNNAIILCVQRRHFQLKW